MKYIYGPVKSRRLGFSLGLSLTLHKACSYDCVYCQLGKTIVRTIQRKEYVDIKEVLGELRLWLENNPQAISSLSYISLSGAGEPTLNSNIRELISEIKKITTVPLAVITNASLLSLPDLRQAISQADLIVPSLDAVSDAIFQKIDRPCAEVNLEAIINGLISLRKEYRGKIWLEVMLVKGVNDDLRHIKKLKEVIERINPDKIQLNSPVRTTAETGVLSVDKNKLEKIREMLGQKCEII